MDIYEYSYHDASVLSVRHEAKDLFITMCTFQFRNERFVRFDLDIQFFNVRQVDSWIDMDKNNHSIWRPLPPDFTLDDMDSPMSDWLSDDDEGGVYTFEWGFRVHCDHAEVISAVEVPQTK